MGVGRSGITRVKQADLSKYLPAQIARICAVHKRWRTRYRKNWPLLFVDGSAGDMSPNFITSPQLFIENTFKTTQNQANEIFLVLIEKDIRTFSKLEEEYHKRYAKHKPEHVDVYLYNDKTENVIRGELNEPSPHIFGLLYFDPNGFQLEPYEGIHQFCAKYPRVDIALNINTNTLRRVRSVSRSGFEKYKDVYLWDIIGNLGKEHVWVRDNASLLEDNKHDLLTIFASNWYGSEPNGCTESMFHHIDTDRGERIVDQYNFTAPELFKQRSRALLCPMFGIGYDATNREYAEDEVKMTHKTDEACRLFIEQEIERGLSEGKTPYSIGKELSTWIVRLFETKNFVTKNS